MQAEQLQPSEAARIFEGQLASALVAEDGQLALSNLAVSAAHGLMPKIQTQGQLGQARWRLISAPSIPGRPCCMPVLTYPQAHCQAIALLTWEARCKPTPLESWRENAET